MYFALHGSAERELEGGRPQKWRVLINRVIIEGSAQDGRQLRLLGVLRLVVVGGVRGSDGGWVDREIGGFPRGFKKVWWFFKNRVII
jgi:hypothetical protein